MSTSQSSKDEYVTLTHAVVLTVSYQISAQLLNKTRL